MHCENQERRDREMRIEIKNGSMPQVLDAIAQFLGSQSWGRMGFEKEGESFSLWATSQIEPTSESARER